MSGLNAEQIFWNQDWFANLPIKYKLFWIYICGNCNDTLHWRPNRILFEKMVGEPINLEEFLRLVNSDTIRIKKTGDGWFIKEIQNRQS